jgi:uncharacterized phage protein (TIGR02220 family)
MELKELWNIAKELVGEDDLTRRFRAWLGTVIRNARMKRDRCNSTELETQDVKTILADLNERSKSRFQVTDKALQMIRVLLKQGYSVDDFRRVHEIKCLQWLGNEQMEYCLRPSTLYRPSHFDEYLAEWHRSEQVKREAAAKKTAAQTTKSAEDAKVEARERAAQVAELNRKQWHEFETWAEFVRHTLNFPDLESLRDYLGKAPTRIREMRQEPRMSLLVITGQSPEWAEKEYSEIKRGKSDGESR